MEDSKKVTPMLKQYLSIKEKYPNHVLFYRLGDFYEMFFEDALNVSKELELTLTARAGTPMCGVPHHSSETYIKRLIDKGYKVAICEQIEDPATTKGLVQRDVVRIVTAGTLIEDSMLDDSTNNFIACFCAEEESCGFVFADLSTGEIHLFQKSGNSVFADIKSELARYRPVEILFNEAFMSYTEISDFIKTKLVGCTGSVLGSEAFDDAIGNILNPQLLEDNADQLSIADMTLARRALMAVLRYFADTQKNGVSRFTNLYVHHENEYMALNLTTRRNLELTETMRNKERRGSLMWVLDKTCTSMGRRKLRQFIERPLVNHLEIVKRLEAVECIVKNTVVRGDLRDALSGVYDLERLMTRVVYQTASPRDVYALGSTARKLPQIKRLLRSLDSKLLTELDNDMSELTDIAELVEHAIMPEPPALTKDGNYINDGFNEQLDALRLIAKDNKSILASLEESERQSTGIKNLRVGFNRVFGYYIEVSKGNISNVPEHYIRKQTITNGERFITEELKRIESDILGANDKIIAIEADIFAEVREYITAKLPEVQATAEALSILDVLCSYAAVAVENDYCKPDITLDNVVEIIDGRHPVVEKVLKGNPFTPNDTYLDQRENRLLMITGPNMAGKSTYMRQVAVIVLMAQIGSFIPAKSARIGVVDKIFTRVGASDDLTAGQSTFMVEMNEVAEILENATERSLVILDEIGRGTSTFDGISIAKSVAEYINSKAIGCKTLFATHYHELIALESSNEGIRNYSVAVMKKGDEIQFLHKIVEGGVDDSYGVEVAKLAGLPKKVINNAKASLKVMERNSKIELQEQLIQQQEEQTQIDFSALAREKVFSRLKSLNIDDLTPREALQILAELKEGI